MSSVKYLSAGVVNTMYVTQGHRRHHPNARRAPQARSRSNTTRGRQAAHGRYDAPIDPIGDVERAVRAERGEVVRGDRLGLAGALEHEELGEDRDGLEEDRERPEDLGDREAVVEEQREDCARA